MKTCQLLLISFALLGAAAECFGLATEHFGPAKLQGHPTVRQPEWPFGMLELVDHDSRVYSRWVNGSEDFCFQATDDQMLELLRLFSEVSSRDHVVTIKAGPSLETTLRGDKVVHNVVYQHIGGISRTMASRRGEVRTFDPTITIYVDPEADRSWWDPKKIPENVLVQSEIDDWPVGSPASPPARQLWHARVVLENQKPGAGVEQGVVTRVTLWGGDDNPGLYLGKVNHLGQFNAAFAVEEMEQLLSGETWLTLTVGNYSVAAEPDHPRLDVSRLAIDPSGLTAVELAEPQFYYGRLLFEDGSEPKKGAIITVSFSYAGPVQVDDEGYFRVSLTPEQLKELEQTPDRRNVYIPSVEDSRQSTALYVFPASKLSRERREAGVIRIERIRQTEQ